MEGILSLKCLRSDTNVPVRDCANRFDLARHDKTKIERGIPVWTGNSNSKYRSLLQVVFQS